MDAEGLTADMSIDKVEQIESGDSIKDHAEYSKENDDGKQIDEPTTAHACKNMGVQLSSDNESKLEFKTPGKLDTCKDLTVNEEKNKSEDTTDKNSNVDNKIKIDDIENKEKDLMLKEPPKETVDDSATPTHPESDEQVASMEYRTAEEVITVDNSSDSGDADSDGSDDSSDEDKTNLDAEKTINKAMTSTRDLSPERKVKLNRYGFEDVRTKGEILPEELPPLEELTITVDENVEMVEVGTVASVVGVLVVVKAGANVPPLNDDTILFVEGHKVMGQVFEVFGPVKTPWYSVRFSDAENIENKGIKAGDKVFCAPKEESFTKFVFVDSLKKIRGSDASWEDNNEPPAKHVEFSDDEEEKRAKAKRKNKKKQSENETQENNDDSMEQKKNRRNNWQPRENPSERNDIAQASRRGRNPFRGQPSQRHNYNNQAGNFGQRPSNEQRYDTSYQANNRMWTPSSNENVRGPPSQFGGPPRFQNQQQFDNSFRQPRGPGSCQPDLFAGNQQFSNNLGNQSFHHNRDSAPMDFGMPPPPLYKSPSPNNPGNFKQDETIFQGQHNAPRFQGRQNAPRFQSHQNQPMFQGQQSAPRFQGQQNQPMFQGQQNPSRFQNPPPRQNSGGTNFTNDGIIGHQTQGGNPSYNRNEQNRPNQFRLHGLNPGPASNNNSFSPKPVPVSERYEQVNLTGGGVGPYRPGSQNNNQRTGQHFTNTGSTPNGSMSSNPWERANNGQNYSNTNERTDAINNMGQFTGSINENQGPFTVSNDGNQSWTANNSQYTNNRTGNPQNFDLNGGYPASKQNVQNFTNRSGNWGNQSNMQACGSNNNSTNLPQRYMSSGSSMTQPPYPTDGEQNIVNNFTNNQNNRPSQVMDHRFIQGN